MQMADKELAVPATAAEVAVYEPPSSFEVVDRGAPEPVRFDTFGDTFTGIFEYEAEVTQEEFDKETGEIHLNKFTQAIFTGADGRPYGIFPGASLARAVKRMEPGTWYSILYERDIPMKPGKNPMKSFVVARGV